MFTYEEIRIRTNALKGLVAETDIHNWHRLPTEAQVQLDAIKAEAGSSGADDLFESALHGCRRLAELVLSADATRGRDVLDVAGARRAATVALDALGRTLAPAATKTPAFATSRSRCPPQSRSRR